MNGEQTAMDELKTELKRDARRHSSKLLSKIRQVIDIPDIVEDSIHQEVLYATMDGYRATVRNTNRNGEQHEQDDRFNR